MPVNTPLETIPLKSVSVELHDGTVINVEALPGAFYRTSRLSKGNKDVLIIHEVYIALPA
jgi:chorismate-pyruvate lyase